MEQPVDDVAAYTAGNHISSRKLQRNPKLSRNVPQWGFSKVFDTYAPLGLALISSSLIGDPRELRLQTIVDGKLRREEFLSDSLFECACLVYYLSQGTILRKGSVIVTALQDVRTCNSRISTY